MQYGKLYDTLVIGNIYRPPRFYNNNSTLREFCQELNPVISNISKNNNDVVITRDFNIDLLQINKQPEIQKYFDLFVTHGLSPQITVPTRSCISSSSLIDHMFCMLKNPKQNIFSCVIKSSLSDHHPYFIVLDILHKPEHRPKYVKVNHSDEASFLALCDEIQRGISMSSLNNDLFANPKDNYNKF